ncbi:FAD-dependent monooxygenase [Thalassotalea fusca]
MEYFDCIVVGGGMVGGAAALSLAELGLNIAVIEQKTPTPFVEDSPYDLRVSAISLGSQFLLEQLDVWAKVNQTRAVPYRRLGVWEEEIAYAEFNASEIQQPHLGHIIENKCIQLALWEKLTAHSRVTIKSPQQVKAIRQDNQQVHVSLDNEELHARILVAADGARSNVRDMVGIGVTGWQYGQSAMLIHVETELPQQDITWQHFRPTGPVAMLPLQGNQASLVWYHQAAEIERLSLLSNDALSNEIQQKFPKKLGKINVIDKGAFSLTRQHANAYVKNQVLLLGDAAHTINPLAGQGVNLGFKDVLALRQVISEAIGNNECWHEPSVLKRYQSKRRADNLAMMSSMDSFYLTFSNEHWPFKLIRNLGLFVANRSGKLKQKALAYACGL